MLIQNLENISMIQFNKRKYDGQGQHYVSLYTTILWFKKLELRLNDRSRNQTKF